LFEAKSKSYFADDFTPAYQGMMNILLREHIEFEIITPRTLASAKSNILILPDVKCINDAEFAQLQAWVKNGKTLIFTGETGLYDGHRQLAKNRKRMQELSVAFKNAICINGNPEKNFQQFLKENFDTSVHKGKYPAFENSEVDKLLSHIRNSKTYAPAVEIENADVCVAQIASVDKKPTVFLANFSGLKGKENANPFPDKDIIVTFHHAKRNASATIIPFMGKPAKLTGKWENGSFKVTLPEITRGAIIQLN